MTCDPYSELHPHRFAQVLHQRHGALAGLRIGIDEVRTQDVGVLVICDRDEVLALEILDVFVLWVESTGRAVERIARKFPGPFERGGFLDLRPGVRIGDDEVADVVRRLRVRVPDTSTRDALARLDMQIEARAVDIPATLVPELNRAPRLVRGLVLS